MGNARVADKMLTELRHVRGITDLRIQQQADYPKFHVVVDRTKAAQGGFYRTGRCQQPFDLAQRQLPGDADVLSQPEERCLL